MAEPPNPVAVSTPSTICQHFSTPQPAGEPTQPLSIPPDIGGMQDPYPQIATVRNKDAPRAAVSLQATVEEVQEEDAAAAGPVVGDDDGGASQDHKDQSSDLVAQGLVMTDLAREPVLEAPTVQASTAQAPMAQESAAQEVRPAKADRQKRSKPARRPTSVVVKICGRQRGLDAVPSTAATAHEPPTSVPVRHVPSMSIPVSFVHSDCAHRAHETAVPRWALTAMSPVSAQVRKSRSRPKLASVEDAASVEGAAEEHATFTSWDNPVPDRMSRPIHYEEPMLPARILQEDILSIADYMPHLSDQTRMKFRWISNWTVWMNPVSVPGPYNVVDIVIDAGTHMDILHRDILPSDILPRDIIHRWRGRVLPDRRGPCEKPEAYVITTAYCEQTKNVLMFWTSQCSKDGPRNGLQIPLAPRGQHLSRPQDWETEDNTCPFHRLSCCDDGPNRVIVPKVEGEWDTQEQVMRSLENLSRPDPILAWAPKEDTGRDKEINIAKELFTVSRDTPYVLPQDYEDAVNTVVRPLHTVIPNKQGDQRAAPTTDDSTMVPTIAPTFRATRVPTRPYREEFFATSLNMKSSQVLVHPQHLERLNHHDRNICARQQEMKKPGWTWKPMKLDPIKHIAVEQAHGAMNAFLITITKPDILVSRYMDEVMHHWGTMNCEIRGDLRPQFIAHSLWESQATWRWNAYYHLVGAAIRRDLCQALIAYDIKSMMLLHDSLAKYWVDQGATASVEALQREITSVFSTMAKGYIVYLARDLINTGVFLAAPRIRPHHILRGETKDYVQPNGSLFTDLNNMPALKIGRTTEEDVVNRPELQRDWSHRPDPEHIFRIHALLEEVAQKGEIEDPRAFAKEIMDLSMFRITSHALSPLIVAIFDKIRLLGSIIDPELVRPASEMDECLTKFRAYTGRLSGLCSVYTLQDFSYESWRSVPKRLYQHIYLMLDDKAHDLVAWPLPMPLRQDHFSVEHELYQFGAALIRHLRDNIRIPVAPLKGECLVAGLQPLGNGVLMVPVLPLEFSYEVLKTLKLMKPDPATLRKFRVAIKEPPSPQEIWEHRLKKQRKRTVYTDLKKNSEHGLAKIKNDKADKFRKKRLTSIENARRRANQALASFEERLRVQKQEARREGEARAAAEAKANEQSAKAKKRQAKVKAGPSLSNGEQAEEAPIASGSFYQKPRVDDAADDDEATGCNRRRAASDATDNTEGTEKTDSTEATDVSEWVAFQSQKLQAKKKQETKTEPTDEEDIKTTPEGLPKGRLQHRHWARITTLLGEGSMAMTWKDVESAFVQIGYRMSYHGGSSVKFTWTHKCQWASTAGVKPESLMSIMFHRPHHNKDIRPSLLHGMCERLGRRGMDLGLLYQYYEMR